MRTRSFAYVLLALLLLALAACQPAAAPAVVPTQPPAAPATPVPAAPAPPATAAPAAAPTSAPAAAPTAAATTALTAARPTPASYNSALVNFQTGAFSGAAVCQGCHGTLKDASGNDVSILNQWRSTTMANAARDPFWQAKVSSEVKRAPALAAVIEEKCANCHMPMAHLQAKADGGTSAMFGKGFLDAANPLHDAALEGVSCTLCHRIEDKNLGKKESFSGGYTVDTASKAPNRPLYGPYPNPAHPEMMQSTTGYRPLAGPQLATAEECATCHNLYTPYVDATGKILGEFPEQTPYTEWQQSTFAGAKTTCISCHMPAAKGGAVISTIPAGLPVRDPFGQHQFAGGNALVLRMLADNGAALGVTAEPAQLDATQARVRDLLAKQSATLKLVSLAQANGQLTAKLQVTTLTGHKFPTSLPVRRAWLHVTVSDAAGKVVFESGKFDVDGKIAGNAADEKADAFEPHYDVITQPDQVQIYEGIMGDSDGKATYTLLRAGKYLKDNRLLPAGFDKAKAPADVAVYGEAAKDDNFVAGGDTVTYQVDVKNATGPFSVKAELLYQPISYRFAQDMASDNTDQTTKFLTYFRAADKTPEVVAVIAPTIAK